MSAQPLAADSETDETPLHWRDHPQPDVLERFMRSELSGEESRVVVRHLLTGCPQCLYITRRLWRGLGEKERATPEAVLKQRLRRLWRQTPPKNTRREAAMAALVKAAQEMLLGIAEELRGIYKRLENIAGALPPWPQGEEEGDDVVREMRAIIESVLKECLRSAIDDLRLAAYYPDEPPAEDEDETAQ
ncbi:MAG TPA: hypothetical protein VGX68_02320 [Thermoanaerobaculia bacterium]|jgi:hypothetical protein|nr:hypothetical protein [Thermoanaerobaculia bacterium]